MTDSTGRISDTEGSNSHFTHNSFAQDAIEHMIMSMNDGKYRGSPYARTFLYDTLNGECLMNWDPDDLANRWGPVERLEDNLGVSGLLSPVDGFLYLFSGHHVRLHHHRGPPPRLCCPLCLTLAL